MHDVNQQTGVATLIGGTGINNLTGLAFESRTNELFASTSASDSLNWINTTIAVSLTVGGLGVDVGGHGVAIDSRNDQLFNIDALSNELITFNLATGIATSNGSLGVVGLAARVVGQFKPSD